MDDENFTAKNTYKELIKAKKEIKFTIEASEIGI